MSANASKHPWWRQAAALTGLGALLVTLIFNTIGVWRGAQQEKVARETEQLRLLTALNDKVTDAEIKLNSSGLPQNRCENLLATKAQEADLRTVMSYYEYLAWLYNAGKLKDTNSRKLFETRLIDARHVASKSIDPREFPQLTRFANGRVVDPC